MTIAMTRPRFVLARVESMAAGRSRSVSVAEADDLAALLDDVNDGGEWTLWERTGDDAPVLVAHFASEPVRVFAMGRGRARNGQFCRTGVPGRRVTQGVTVADIETMIARFAANQSTVR